MYGRNYVRPKKREVSELSKIDFEESNSLEEFKFDGDTLVKYIGNAKKVIVPDNIKHLNSEAFLNNNTVEEIILQGIEGCLVEKTFLECKNLKRVTISSGVTHIEKKCFVKCPKLERITFLSMKIKFDQDIFNIKKKLIVLAPEMSPIAFKAVHRIEIVKNFAKAYANKEIYKPSPDSGMIAYIKRQSQNLYKNLLEMPELLNVMIDYSLISVIDAHALHDEFQKKAPSMAELLKEYLELKDKKNCINKSNKKTLDARMKKEWDFQVYSYTDESTGSKGEVIKIIKYKGFITDVIIPDTIDGKIVDRIEQMAFYENEHITSVVVPETVKYIGVGAFALCSKLERVEIKGKNVFIDRVCFGSCGSLSEFIADYDSISWGPHMFQCCDKLMSPDGFVIMGAKGRERLVDVSIPISKSTIKVPYGVVIINDYAFSAYEDDGIFRHAGSYVYKLQKVILPETVTTIGKFAFADCINLREINIPSSVSEIMSYAFIRCDSLREVAIHESVTELHPYIFGTYLKNGVSVIGEKGGNVEKYIDNYNADVFNNSNAKIKFVSNE